MRIAATSVVGGSAHVEWGEKLEEKDGGSRSVVTVW